MSDLPGSDGTGTGRRRMIALDLDGTLLGPDGDLSARNAAAIHAVAAAGHRVVIATGRPPHLATVFADRLGTAVTHVVATNGTMIATFPDGQLLQMLGFPADDGFEAIRTVRSADERYAFAAVTDAGFAHERGFAERMPAAVSSEPIDDVATIGGTEMYKLFAFHPVHSVDEVLALLPALLPPTLVANHMGADAVDIGPPFLDKRAGLTWLCEELNIDPQNVIAIGDEGNDLTMLQWAGHGIAMANAPDHVRRVADEIAPPNTEDGVAQILERLLA